MITDAREVDPRQRHLPARFLVEAAAHNENRAHYTEDTCTGCTVDHDRVDCPYRLDRRGLA